MIDDDEGEVDTSSSTTTTAANDDHIATGVPFSGTTAVASSKEKGEDNIQREEPSVMMALSSQSPSQSVSGMVREREIKSADEKTDDNVLELAECTRKSEAEEIRGAIDDMIELTVRATAENQSEIENKLVKSDEGTRESMKNVTGDRNNEVESESTAAVCKSTSTSSKKKKKETAFERMMRKATITKVPVIIRYYRCRICLMSVSSPSELMAHVKLVHNLRCEGNPIIEPHDFVDDDGDGWQKSMDNLSKALEAGEANQYTEEEKLELHKKISEVKKPVNEFYRCKLCFVDFKVPEELRFHMVLHNQNKIVTCSHCDMAFTTEYDLKKHQNEVVTEGQNVHTCTHMNCTAAFSNRKCYLFHLTSHDGLHRCQICEKTYEYSDQVLHHVTEAHVLKRDESGPAVRNSNDGDSPRNVVRLESGELNLLTNAGGKIGLEKHRNKVPCGLCNGKLFLNITKHMRSCHSQFKCPLCKKRWSSLEYLNQHIKTIHPDTEEITIYVNDELKDSDKPFQCTICSKQYSKLWHLSAHYNKDHGVKKRLRLSRLSHSGSKLETTTEVEQDNSRLETIPDEKKSDIETPPVETEGVAESSKISPRKPEIVKDDFGRYLCTICGIDNEKAYKTRQGYLSHCSKVHNLVIKRAETDTDEEDENKMKERCAICRCRYNWLQRHISSQHPNYPNPNPQTTRKRKVEICLSKIPRRLKKYKVSSEEEDGPDEEVEDEDDLFVPVEAPNLDEMKFESNEESELELDEDNFEPVAAPESEKSDLSDDDDDLNVYVDGNVDRDDGIIDNGFNKPPYKCTQCGKTQYTQLGNLNRHEKMHHSKFTVLNDENRRILVPCRGVIRPIRRYFGRRRRRGGRRGSANSSGRSRGPQKRVVRQPSVEMSGVSTSTSDVQEITDMDTSSLPLHKDEIVTSIKHTVAKSEQSVSSASLGSSERRVTRSSRSFGSSPISAAPVVKSDSSEETNSEDSEDSRGDRKIKNEIKCFKCTKTIGSINGMTRHLRSDHLTDEMTVKVFCMGLGSYICPYCSRNFKKVKGKENKLLGLRNHIKTKHNKDFPSDEEITKLKEEIHRGIQLQDSSRQNSKLSKRVLVKVEKMETEEEARYINGNSLILSNSSEEKLVERMVGDVYNQTSLQSTGSNTGERETENMQSSDNAEPSKAIVTFPKPEPTDTAAAVPVDSNEKDQVTNPDVHNAFNQQNIEEESIPVKESSDLSYDNESSPEFRNSSPAILQMDIYSDSIEPKSEPLLKVKDSDQANSSSLAANKIETESTVSISIKTEDIVSEPLRQVKEESDLAISSPSTANKMETESMVTISVKTEDIVSAPSESNSSLIKSINIAESEPSPLPSERKPLVLNVTIPPIKLSSSTAKRRVSSIETDIVELPARPTTGVEETTTSQEKVNTSSEVIIIEEKRKTELEASSKKSPPPRKSIQPAPKRRQTLDLGTPIQITHTPPLAQFEKPPSLLTPYQIKPDMLVVADQPSSSSQTTPTPVTIKNWALPLPGDPKTPTLMSIQPSLTRFASSSSRVRFVSVESKRIFRCSICNLLFPSKEVMSHHLLQAHQVTRLDPENEGTS